MINLEQVLAAYPEYLRANQRAILREYLQCKILQYIGMSPIASKLAFIGGTSIRILYGSQRFSEDLDFDNFGLEEGEFALAADYIAMNLEREGLDVEITSNRNKTVFHYRVKFPGIFYKYGLSGHANEKLYIKVDSEAQGIDYQPELKLVQRLDVQTNVRCSPLPTLLSQKLNAYFDRVQGRDLYDIAFLFGLTKPDYSYLSQKLNIDNANQLRVAMLVRLQEMDTEILFRDIERFLFFPERDLAYIQNFERFITETCVN